MAISYKRAPEVQSGDPITSAQWNELAKAYNDRLENGVADPSWRLFWYADALFQYIRQGDGSNNPARDEWWSHWSHLRPEDGKNWPLTAPGSVGGINPSNPIAAFVYGNSGLDIYNETDRLNYDPADGSGILLHSATGSPVSDYEHWDIAKVQRGVTDSTGSEITLANAIYGADRYYRINYGSAHSYLKGYGGFFASPQAQGKCNDEAYDKYTIKFRKISTQTDCTYTTCPDLSGTGGCPGTSKFVLGWFAGVYGYVLYHKDNTTTILPYTDYVEGPYTGNAFLRHERGGQLDYALDVYATEFRGADTSSVSQRNESTWNPQKHAFHFEDFFTRQYYLAPARGVANSDYAGALTAVYPQFDFPAGKNTGDYGNINSQNSYTVNTSFVFAGFIAVGSNLTSDKSFGIYVDGKKVKEITIPAGAATDKSHYFANVFKAGSVVQVKTQSSFTGSESAYVEIAELLEMTPRVQDAYVVLRMASARNQTMDGWGHEEADAKGIWDSYRRHGMAVNHLASGIKGQEPQGLWKNPVYEETRRITHERLRLVKRNHLVGYEINSSGNSVLHYTRFPNFQSSGVDSDIDIFRGMAPSVDAVNSGYIKAGYKYIVTGSGASINYNGVLYSENQIFTAKRESKNWTVASGSPVIYEHDLVVSTAPEQGETNEWQMFMQTLPYKPAGGSVYKPEVFADRDGMFIDRCTLLSEDWSETTDLAKEIRAHVYNRQRIPINRQENPSGYRYLLGTNEPTNSNVSNLNPVAAKNGPCVNLQDETNCAGQVAHYNSCKIYVPDYQVKNITYNRTSGHVEVELDGRLYHNENVDNQFVSNNSTSWAVYMAADDTGGAAARSDENAVIEYLLYITLGDNDQCTIRIGDQSGDANTQSHWYATQYNGACMPRFHFVKKMPYVFEDNNNTLNEHDSRLTVDNMLWAGFVLRAICEGYIDHESDSNTEKILDPFCERYHCGESRMFDYRYATLMTQAMSNRWFSMHPDVADGDNWEGYGPFPQMKAYALHFNQISKAINLLTRARIELPTYGVRSRRKTYTAFHPLTDTSGNCQSNESVTLPDNLNWTLTNETNWIYEVPTGACGTDAVILQATKAARLDTNSENQCGVAVTRVDIEFDLAFGANGVETMAYYGLPERLRDMVVGNQQIGAQNFGSLAADNNNTTTHSRVLAPSQGYDQCNIVEDGTRYEFPETNTITVDCKTVISGVLEAEKPRTSAYVNITACNKGSDVERNYTFSANRSFIDVPLV